MGKTPRPLARYALVLMGGIALGKRRSRRKRKREVNLLRLGGKLLPDTERWTLLIDYQLESLMSFASVYKHRKCI